MVPLKKPKVTVKTYPWWNWASYMFWARSKKWKIGNSNIQKIPIQSYIHNIKRGRVRGKTGRGLTMQKKNKSKCLPNCQSKHFFFGSQQVPQCQVCVLGRSNVGKSGCQVAHLQGWWNIHWILVDFWRTQYIICYIYTHTRMLTCMSYDIAYIYIYIII